MAFLSFCMAVGLTTIGQQDRFGSTRVAVVDVPVVSERYLRTSDLEARFEQRRVKFNRERDALREKMERAGRSLQEEFKPGTGEYGERRKQLAMLEAELQWFMETEGEKIERHLASSLRSIYDDIQAIVGEVAKEQGIDVIAEFRRLAPDTEPISIQRWSPRRLRLTAAAVILGIFVVFRVIEEVRGGGLL
ncbi:MAG: OmpH family outer membrane protein [Planctomycetes bacterium]|nr:OmpH family outer membrane protein [Planctomycetota bacterium]